MPTYEYECSKCGKTFDFFQSMNDAPLTDCPEEGCGGKGTLKRLIGSGAGIIFKGSGFYETDYKNKSTASTTSAPIAKKEEAKPSCGCSNEGKCPFKS